MENVFFLNRKYVFIHEFQKWQLGTVFLPDSVGYLIGTSFMASPAFRLGRARFAAAALVLVATSDCFVSTRKRKTNKHKIDF